LINKLYQIGKSLLKGQGEHVTVKVSDAISWLRNAFKIVDQFQETTAADIRELRVCSQASVLLVIRAHRHPYSDIVVEDAWSVDGENFIEATLLILILPSPTQPELTF
jgi:hypothetical protein